MDYALIKALHLISMVAWFAGLFYIFRLFVYHVKNKENKAVTDVLETMEKKLLYAIMHPAMLLTLVFGVWLLIENPALFKQKWMHTKITLVLFLIGYQIFSGIVRRKFAAQNFFLSERACRIINEVPTLILISVVLLAILKPL